MDHLVDQGVKLLVIACNSASAAVLRDARERYDVPVVEVVHPAVRRAVSATRNGRVGVIGTRATIDSGAYEDAFAAAPHLQLTTRACPRFVEFVEAGVTSGPDLLAVAHEYLDPVVAAGVDTLVLGCTHYPLLTGVLSYVMGDRSRWCPAPRRPPRTSTGCWPPAGCSATALPMPEHRFLATGDPEEFTRLGRRFLGPEVVRAEPADLDERPRAQGSPGEADRRRLLRLLPRSGLARLLLPGRARRLPARRRPGQRRARRAAAVRRPARRRRRLAQPPARRPLHRRHVVLRRPAVPPRGLPPAAAGPRPGGHGSTS